MRRYTRQAAIGAGAGLISSVILVATGDNVALGLVLGLLIGIGYTLAFPITERTYADSMLTTAALGIPFWGVFSVIVGPLLSGQTPQWTAAGLHMLFPQLVGWVLYGGALGLFAHSATHVSEQIFGPIPATPVPVYSPPTRIVILGGGFAGMTVAAHLEKVFGLDPTVSFTLISDTNALLFTPMLAEVAGSSLEPTHISTPLRTSLRRSTVMRGRAIAIDIEKRGLILAADSRFPAQRHISYDHLVLALGAKSHYLGLKNVEEYAFDFKTLLDAERIRNRVIDMFEAATATDDPALRRALLTFVIAGGGFSGAELAGALNDFARGLVAFYPGVTAEELQVILAHPRERILPELSESLATYAHDRMAARGVTFKLKTRVKDVQPTRVTLDPAETIPTHSVIWTAGTRPHPLIQTLPVPLDTRGAVMVENTLAVPGFPGLWALGDCAAVPNGTTGQMAPPTAQFALREATRLAANIRATIQGRPLQPFAFRGLGTLCVVGYQTACAEILGLRFSGLFAWLLWRAIYWEKLPGLERKVRVLADWGIELFFPRDIVQTLAVTDAEGPHSGAPFASSLPENAMNTHATALNSAKEAN